MKLSICLKKTSLIILITQTVCTAFIFAYPYKIKFRHLNVPELKPHTRITCIYKDHLGFMWFGTPKGLVRYDGNNVKVYKHMNGDSTSISENYINFIMEDSRNNLWIGTMGGGINLYNREKDSFSRLSLPEEENAQMGFNIAYCMAEDSSGNLWFGFDTDGLVQYFPEQDIAINYKTSNELYPNCPIYDDIWSLCVDSSNTLWIGTFGGGLDRLDIEKGTFQHYIHSPDNPHSISSNKIWKLFLDSKQNLWIGTFDNGLNLFDRKNNRFLRFTHNPDDPYSISCNSVFSIVEDKENNLWVGTETGGLNLFDKKTGKFYHYKHNRFDPFSISHNSVDYLHIDEIGTVWIGTYAGGVDFFNLNLENFKHYYPIPFSNSLSNSNVTSFVEDSTGNVWIGTDGGGLNLWDRKSNVFKHFKHSSNKDNSLPDNVILCMVIDDDKNIWIGTYKNGIAILNPKTGKFRNYATTPGDLKELRGKDIRNFFKDKDGNIWIGGPHLGLLYYDKKQKKLTRPQIKTDNSNTFLYHYIYFIYQDSQGDMWFGTYGSGLFRLNLSSSKIETFHRDSKDSTTISSNSVYCITEDSKNRLWIGTRIGLNLFDKKTRTFRRIKVPELASTGIMGIVEDNQGNLWISTDNGLIRFNYDSGRYRRFDEEDGLQGNEFRKGAFLKLSSGEILFGGANGFNIFDPANFRINTKVPPVIVSKIELIGTKVDHRYIKSLHTNLITNSRIELPYYLNSFSITFSALNYWLSNKNQYAYMVKNHGNDWVYLGNSGEVTFLSMSFGEHKLLIKASNNDGIWNEKGKEITIKIIPPFYRTTTFYILMLIFLGVTVALYIHWRLRTINRRNILLNQINRRLEDEIQKRKETEETLRKSEEKYREIVENAPLGIAIHRDWKIIYCNKTFMDIFKVKSKEEVIGKNPISLTKEEYKEIATKRIKEQYENLKIAPPTEEVLIRANGEELIAVVSAVPVKTHDGYVDSHVFITDITQRKKIEEERLKLKEQLQQSQKLEAIGHLAGGIAHDFNNILTVILGYIDILQKQKLLDENVPADRFISPIRNAAVKAKELVSQLLAFGRKQVYTPTVVNINELLEGTKEMLRRLISEDIELIFQPGENVPTIYADSNQIEQILINLVINARDAILEKKAPGDKKIIIRTEQVFLDKTYAQTHVDTKEGYYVCISVEDTGIGMNKETISKIFLPFFTTKEKGKGTGMGLSSVYGIVKQNGGTINVHSEPGKGTIFKIYWPAQEYEIEDIEKTLPKAQEDRLFPGSEKILFVEDEESIRELISETLKTLGYKVKIASSGIEALEILEQTGGDFDLIITDIIMPGISGTELAETVRKKFPHIKILFTSGYGEDYITYQGKFVGKIEFLTKPYTMSQLSRKIRELLNEKST